MSITNNRTDFIGATTKVPTEIKGATGSTKVEEQRMVRWKIEDDKGQVHDIELPAMLNTKSPSCLWSPQQWAQHINDEDGTTATSQEQDSE